MSGIVRVSRTAHRADRAGRIVIGAAVALLTACAQRTPDARVDTAGGDVAPAEAAAPAVAPACAPGNGGITLPEGFCATIFDDSAVAPRHIAVAANGDVYTNRQARRAGAAVLALRDTNGDGRADVRATFGTGFGTGVAVVSGWVYVDEGSRIARYRLAEGALAPSGEPEVIVTGLPTGGHGAHTMVIDGRGNLFVNVGSSSNSCQQTDRTPKSPGRDPCTELETRAGTWRFSATTPNQSFSPGARYATGLRNAMALAINPADGALYAAVHGRDGLTQQWSFSERDGAELPSEELVKVDQGTDAGWPYCYHDPFQKKKVLAPEYGGDGKQVGRCAGKADPVVAFPGHWAPMALAFYDKAQFPAKYRGGAFVAFHGSWNRAPLPQQGFRVTFSPLDGNRFTGAFETFADGFTGQREVTGNSNAVAHRPAGLAVSPDGGLYVTDDRGGRIWKIVYVGR